MVGVKVQAWRDEVEEQGRQTNKITKYKCRSGGHVQNSMSRDPLPLTEVRSELSMALLEKDEQ
jgi:hypothetical protein